jgi:hypothetical protein
MRPMSDRAAFRWMAVVALLLFLSAVIGGGPG